MPIYEFEGESCGERFEELVATGTTAAACPACGAERSHRVFSPVSPPSRQPRGPAVRDSEARRTEREAQRRERLAETKKKRAAGELPPRRPRSKGGAAG